jgi:hypothetical protein
MPFSDSLTANAYGIYLLHYVLVSWVCLALLPAALPGAAKGAIAFVAAAGGAWALTAALRRVPALARIL